MKHSIKNRVVSGTGLIMAVCLFISAIILVNAALTTWRIDLTENKLFTLSEGTINILQNLEEPVQLDYYFSRQALVDFPQMASYGVRVRDMLEEYAAYAEGKLILNVIEPEIFSEAEDQAVAGGLRAISTNTANDRAYFGLVGTNSTDDEKVIPFFQINRESALEYDLTKLIYNLAYPDKRVVGVITGLPLFNTEEKDKEWTIVNALREFSEVRDLTDNPAALTEDIDVLMLVHPKELDNDTLYAVDQYLLRGGKALIFIDPLAEQDKTEPDPETPNVMPKRDSYLPELLEIWGLEMTKEKIVGDLKAAMRVQASSSRGQTEVDYLPWLRLTKANFNTEDFSTSELNSINMGTVGALEIKEDKGLSVTPLIETSTEATRMERDLVLFQRNPTVILNNFKSENKKLMLAARLMGQAKTFFPDGRPVAEEEGEEGEEDGEKAPPVDDAFVEEGEINVILVADSDILADDFWIRKRSIFGVSIPQSIANNGDFVVNSVDNLSGNTDLISLRSRGKYSRPFDKVEAIRKEAETRFRQREKELKASLAETEKNIRELQGKQESDQSYLLNNQLTEEIAKFRSERVKIRKELRSVQHELRKNIEKLGAQVKFINIGLIPLLITLLALGIGIYQSNRRI